MIWLYRYLAVGVAVFIALLIHDHRESRKPRIDPHDSPPNPTQDLSLGVGILMFLVVTTFWPIVVFLWFKGRER